MDERVKTEILDSIAENQDEILEFTKALVAIPSENPPGVYYRQCVEAIREKLTEIGLDSDLIEVPDHPSSDLPRFCILSS